MASTSKRHTHGQQDYEREPYGRFKQVSGHIYELYRLDTGSVQLEILFFHGLQLGDTLKAYMTTWTNENYELWPWTWLPQKLPQACIFSVSYDSSMKKSPKKGRLEMYHVGENLTYDIPAVGIGQTSGCPVILVGHCFGGLVIKKFCVQAQQKDQENEKMTHFLKNLGGIFFYGTPHSETRFISLVSRVLDGRLLVYVKTLSKHAARLDDEFRRVCQQLLLEKKVASVGESRKTKLGHYVKMFPFYMEMVPEASARYGDYCYTLDADHFTICKPETKNSMGFKILLEFIGRIKPEKQDYAIPDNFQPLPKATIGLDSKVEEVLKMTTETKLVGIVGMGGIDKTTLAKAVFNKLCSFFECTCFLSEVKLLSGGMSGGVMAKNKKVDKLMCHMGYSSIAWWKKKLLLVFDDISSDDDIDVFSKMIEKATPDSLYVITSRDEGLLRRLGDVKLYRMLFLTDIDAEILFKIYAFPNQSTIPPYLDKHIEKIVKQCEGLPLMIEVLGQCLKEKKNEKFWMQMLTALELADKYPGFDRVWRKLKYSYETLNPAQQGMFLDATTFFADHSWKLHKAKAAWSKVYGSVELLWQTLVDASLVYAVKEDDTIRVHEQLKSLGRKIAREDNSYRRVWSDDEGLEVLRCIGASKFKEIGCLRISADSWTNQAIPTESLFKLKTLKYLENKYVENNCLDYMDMDELSTEEREPPKTFPADLIALSTSTFRLHPTLRIDFDDLHNPCMVVLKLNSYSEGGLPEFIARLSSLKIFNICKAKNLQTLPTFGNLSALQSVEFDECSRLQTLPDSFWNLSALKSLKLRKCYELKLLPDSFRNLSALETLEVDQCSLLETLPETCGELSALQSLKLRHCFKLRNLPDSFRNLFNLKSLEFYQCSLLQNLTDVFGKLSALQSLKFHGCFKLQTLPISFKNLFALELLEFHECYKLQTLPNFKNLSALQSLSFRMCSELQSLPESFGQLCSLTHFTHFGDDGRHGAILDSIMYFSKYEFTHLWLHQEKVSYPDPYLHLYQEEINHLDPYAEIPTDKIVLVLTNCEVMTSDEVRNCIYGVSLP